MTSWTQLMSIQLRNLILMKLLANLKFPASVMIPATSTFGIQFSTTMVSTTQNAMQDSTVEKDYSISEVINVQVSISTSSSSTQTSTKVSTSNPTISLPIISQLPVLTSIILSPDYLFVPRLILHLSSLLILNFQILGLNWSLNPPLQPLLALKSTLQQFLLQTPLLEDLLIQKSLKSFLQQNG